MAASMSSSETRTRRAASPNGMNESAAATGRVGAANPASTSAGDDRLTDTARLPGLVDHDHPADGSAWRGDLLDRERGQPAQVQHAAVDPLGRQALGDAQRTGTTRWPR